MMLINEDVHHIGQRMMAKFRKLDEDEHGHVKLSDVKKVLEEINTESVAPPTEA
jgi:Ca2+-binding EF-hand superfamily protein